MAIRAGMYNLITRLRTMTNSSSDPTALPYFTDAQLQDILDGNVTFIRSESLRWLPEVVTGGTSEYHDLKTNWRDLEESTSGTAYWTVKDSLGNLASTANYTANYIDGLLRFTPNVVNGTAYYLNARSYDLNAAAADLYMQRAAYFSDWYQFEGDGQRFMRQQAFSQSKEMADYYRTRTGQNRQRGGIKSNVFVRTDLNRSEY